LLVDDAAGRWVLQITSRVFHEEPLGDALITNNHRDLRLVGGFVVHGVDGSLKLRNLRCEHLVLHGFTYTIAVDNEVRGELVVVLFRKGSDRSHQ